MSRWSHEVWLRDIDADELAETRRYVEDYGFWAYVDSQANSNGHPGPCQTRMNPALGMRVDCSDWRHVRGDDTCLAANSYLIQCGQPTLRGLPFCDFHFDRVWKAALAFVTQDRDRVEAIHEKFERQTVYSYYEIDAAAVRDARRVLAAQPEQVYFFAADHAVKIGRSINPAHRVKSFGATKAPEDVDPKTGVLLGTIPGGHHVESALHLRFRPHRLVGEWFALEPIREDIEHLLSQDADLAETA